MFYCEQCRATRNWPGIIPTSYGACEMCDTTTVCFDTPSALLAEYDAHPPWHVASESREKIVDDVLKSLDAVLGPSDEDAEVEA